MTSARFDMSGLVTVAGRPVRRKHGSSSLIGTAFQLLFLLGTAEDVTEGYWR